MILFTSLTLLDKLIILRGLNEPRQQQPLLPLAPSAFSVVTHVHTSSASLLAPSLLLLLFPLLVSTPLVPASSIVSPLPYVPAVPHARIDGALCVPPPDPLNSPP